MFVVTIDGVDSSAHTLEVDAEAQKTRFEAAGASNVVIVEKDTYEPDEPWIA